MDSKDVYVVLGEYIYPDGKRSSSDIWGIYSSLDAANKKRDKLQRIEDETHEERKTFPGYRLYRVVKSTIIS